MTDHHTNLRSLRKNWYLWVKATNIGIFIAYGDIITYLLAKEFIGQVTIIILLCSLLCFLFWVVSEFQFNFRVCQVWRYGRFLVLFCGTCLFVCLGQIEWLAFYTLADIRFIWYTLLILRTIQYKLIKTPSCWRPINLIIGTHS